MADEGRVWVQPPRPPTSFVGRELDIGAVERLLAVHRLVTVVGPGGAGKTRLTAEVAARAGPVRFVDLTSVDDAASTARVIVAAGEAAEPGTLVLVDNCEHVEAAASAAITALLDAAPVIVLATSRVRLGLPTEAVHHVGPLAPEAAVQLFCDRAALLGVVEDAGPAMAALCEHLDHLPLALELAAARSRTFTPTELLLHLEAVPLLTDAAAPGRPDRHRTLRAAVEWSVGLLSEDERLGFRRLSAPAGAFDRPEALHVLCAEPAGLDPAIAADVLDRLVETSLVQATRRDSATWFRLPFVIRAVARSLLGGTTDERAARAGILAWLLDVAEQLRSTTDAVAIHQRLDLGVDDVRATLAWASEDGRHAPLVLLAATLCPWWQLRGQPVEGTRWLELAHAVDDGAEPAAAVRLLNGLANLAQASGDLVGARTRYEECLEVRRRIGHAQGTATTLNDLGTCCLAQGDVAAAGAALEEALSLHTEAADRWGQACAALNLGIVERQRGDLDAAVVLIDRAIAGFSDLGDPLHALIGRVNVASIDLVRERWADAAACLGPAIADASRAGALALLPPCLEAAAVAALGLGDAERSATLLGAADGLRDHHGLPRSPEERTETDELRARLHERSTGIRRGRLLPLDEVVGLAQVGGETPPVAPAEPPPAPMTLRLVHEGDTWAVGAPGREHRIRATKGLTYLARLVARPEREVHVLDLAGSSSDLAGGAGPVLDEQARAAFHARWRDLQEDLAEAERFGDAVRAGRIEQELDALTSAVAGAVGLGGRARRDGDPAERARKAVTNRLRDTIARIGASDPTLGRHLEAAVRTGTYCVYAPDRPVTWLL
jgi:predicted ATPase